MPPSIVPAASARIVGQSVLFGAMERNQGLPSVGLSANAGNVFRLSPPVVSAFPLIALLTPMTT
ncbi:MAG: hypothetical protein EBW31_03900 [Actinobacteria bacterium]|nr:hypothetical protein [Actinomycetota bacterium]